MGVLSWRRTDILAYRSYLSTSLVMNLIMDLSFDYLRAMLNRMDHFMDLKAAQVAMDLVEEVYRLCRKLPKDEVFGLSSQLKRSSSGIVANIAEGFGRYTFCDKAHHFTIARGECSEVLAHLLIAVRVQLLSPQEIHRALALEDQTGRLLSGLILSSRKRAISHAH